MPHESEKADIAVIGAGIVGLAVAMTLSRRYPRYKILVIEKESRIATHQTGHNSGVIHSGIYYKPGSLKARFCVEGASEMVRFAEENGVPHKICGKLIIATDEKEVLSLKTLWERGLANGVPGLKFLSPEQIKEREPYAEGLAGVYSPSAGIIDYPTVAQAMKGRFCLQGGKLLTSARIFEINKTGDEFILKTTAGDFLMKYLINCGGLHADFLAKMAGLKPDVQIVPFLGEYYMVKDDKKYLVRNLIYPVPDPVFPFLGVHFTRTINGGLEAGPNALLAFAREGYQLGSFKVRDVLEMGTKRGFWSMIRKYWKTGIRELLHSVRKKSFVRSLQRLVPEIKEDDLVKGPTGVRAQCVDRNGFLVDDFKIVEASNSIHVLNVPSPAATASLRIADFIARLAEKSFALRA